MGRSGQFGDPKAQFGLGVMHTFGQGVPKDDTRAMDWYRRAAERGHAGAQLFLGHGLESGNGAEQNLEAAFFWFLRAAEQGEARAQNNLGRLYETGRGTNRDLDIALYWYEESARNGNMPTPARTWPACMGNRPPLSSRDLHRPAGIDRLSPRWRTAFPCVID